MQINFEPELSVSSVPLPEGATFVVANSCVESQKAATAALRFNLRSIEASLASFGLVIPIYPSSSHYEFIL
jgi:hypothetical protein